MNTISTPVHNATAPHWIEIVDGQGQCPPWRLGPFADAREAQRMERGVRRLINLGRFRVALRAEPDALCQPVTRIAGSSADKGSSVEAKCQNAA
jgi:hypothetical protein